MQNKISCKVEYIKIISNKPANYQLKWLNLYRLSQNSPMKKNHWWFPLNTAAGGSYLSRCRQTCLQLQVEPQSRNKQHKEIPLYEEKMSELLKDLVKQSDRAWGCVCLLTEPPTDSDITVRQVSHTRKCKMQTHTVTQM